MPKEEKKKPPPKEQASKKFGMIKQGGMGAAGPVNLIAELKMKQGMDKKPI